MAAPCVVAHGGAGSDARHRDGPAKACLLGLAALQGGENALEATVRAAVHLEDDPRFNAGTGSVIRLDGKTIEMDASCMTSDGKFGAVTLLRDVKNPILVARKVMETPHRILGGEGALRFARAHGFKSHDPTHAEARREWERRRAQVADKPSTDSPWDLAALRRHWNFATSMKDALGCDTIGAVARAADGTFAAANSTGGTSFTIQGRIGDSPVPGCGLYAGPAGAVATTGRGEEILREFLALRVYERIEQGMEPAQACQWGVERIDKKFAIGVIAVGRTSSGGACNRPMAWAKAPR
ncbi:MAG: isoaspartyl peptidase/L-asparaginase [Planctomycetes bacterium]|nr:isoaspartyl peptidase/L-asparaginase [Planctomycetota bacterium]